MLTAEQRASERGLDLTPEFIRTVFDLAKVKSRVLRLDIPNPLEKFLEPGKSAETLNAHRLETQVDRLKPAPFFWFEDQNITKGDLDETLQALLNGVKACFINNDFINIICSSPPINTL